MVGLNAYHGWTAAVWLATASTERVSYALASSAIRRYPNTQYRHGSHDSELSSIARQYPGMSEKFCGMERGMAPSRTQGVLCC